ncbi:hypothetical protein RLOC_00006362 [Lonchura striata]|uniref:Uncharacterized protein n=1 Tax=Lonchura striata TaxID=40157 RepID=A0A218V9Y8_9PASE|nr:hypothetical protein RLOC_00006362 [Lonchura striata domestica]
MQNPDFSEMKPLREAEDLERLFEAYGIKLELLRDLSDAILRDGLLRLRDGSRTSQTSMENQAAVPVTEICRKTIPRISWKDKPSRTPARHIQALVIQGGLRAPKENEGRKVKRENQESGSEVPLARLAHLDLREFLGHLDPKAAREKLALEQLVQEVPMDSLALGVIGDLWDQRENE